LTPLLIDSGTLVSLLAETAERAAQRKGRTLASVTVPVECDDPVAVVFASRRASDPWFCWQQPDREVVIAALGQVHTVTARGPGRFREVAAECAHISGEAVVSTPDEGSPATSPVTAPLWAGGFAFDDSGARDSHWSSFEPASMVLPEVCFTGAGEEAVMTVNMMVGHGSDAGEVASAAAGRVASLTGDALPMLDPHLTHKPSIESSRSPREFERSVSEAISRISSGEIDKVVLAREVVVRSGSAHSPAAIFAALREGFPACFNFCVGTPEAAFIGASPELLVRCTGRTVSTVGLAGSTRRSSDPAVDDHLAEKLLTSPKDRAEQGLVTGRIVKSLSRISVWVEAAAEPGIVKVANIQHLATPVVAQLSQPRTAIELAGLLHPTPAVGGEPWKRAGRVMAEVEQLDRGWYAGPVGWMDGSGDGEFCVALRSALLRDREARLFAGVGVVADSDPASELAETEMKLGALLPLIGG
jgi:salicylate biosynthesis isochorismate synthase/menaquinone-specific isochorismate synthase